MTYIPTTPEDLLHWMHTSGILQKHGIQKIGIFGSFARREPHNDIDVLLEDEVIDWKTIEAFRNEFQLATGEKLDIMVRKFAEPLILKTALRDIRYATIS